MEYRSEKNIQIEARGDKKKVRDKWDAKQRSKIHIARVHRERRG